LGWRRFALMSWADFEFEQIGHGRRVERGFDYVRHLIAAEFNSSGFSKKKVSATDVIKLPMLDKAGKTKFIPMPKERLDRMLKIMNDGNH